MEHRRLERAAAAAIVLVPLLCVLLRCAISDSTPWIVPDPAAPWISVPMPVTAAIQQWGEERVPESRFSLRFRSARAADATLRLRALGDARVLLDGVEIAALPRAGERGRARGEVALPASLQGAHELTVAVRNARGPALLSLASAGLDPEIATGPHWSVRVDGGASAPAELADDTRVNPLSLLTETPAEALADRRVPLLLLFLLGTGGFVAARRLPAGRAAALAAVAVPWLASAVWLVLFVRRFARIGPFVGFDARHHLEYTARIVQGDLPLAAEGWSTFHPPLFHALAAVIETLGGSTLPAWKLLPWLAGLASIWVAWGLARLLFAGAPARIALATLFAASLPVNVYSAAYFNNESLHAVLAGTAMALGTALLLAERVRTGAVLAAGALLGLAALAKFTALLVLPILLAFLLWKLLVIEARALLRAAAPPLLCVVAFALVAGWFYARNWLHYGTPIVGNWALSAPDQLWWQQPGFHTPHYYLRFGEALVHPYLSGFHSFWDALYSTLWGDGFIGGRGNPAQRHDFWSYGFLSAGYWLALPATLLLLAGGCLLAREAWTSESARRRAALGFLLATSWGAFLAFAALTLELAFFAQAKAAYLLLLTPVLALAFARGFGALDVWLADRTAGGLRALLYGWLASFVGAVILAYAG